MTDVLVRARYIDLDGNPMRGRVKFTPAPSYFTTASDDIVATGVRYALLDSTGAMEISLAASNDAGLSPSGWTYTVEEELQETRIKRTYSILVSSDDATDGVDLAEAAPVESTVGTGDAGGAGSAAVIAKTTAELTTAITGGTLIPGARYVSEDWDLPSLPGPNVLIFTATDENKLSGDVVVATPWTGGGGADLGPHRGVYNFTLGYMTTLEDKLGNRLTAISGPLLSHFPWGNPNWVNNTIYDGSGLGLRGAIAAAEAGCSFIGNTLNSGVVDMRDWTSGAIGNCEISNGSNLVLPPTFTASHLVLDNTTLDIDVDAGPVEINHSRFYQVSAWAIENPVGFTMNWCEVRGGATYFNEGATQRGIDFENCNIIDTPITIYRTGGTGRTDVIKGCNFHSGYFDMTGVGHATLDQIISNCQVTSEGAITVVNAAHNTPCEGLVVESGANLNLNGGSMAHSRIACGADVTTGAFAHLYTIIEGQFTVTLTAANVNRLKNKGFSDIV